MFGTEETILFLDGKKFGVEQATQPPSRPTHFVIGNVGEDHNRLFFHGQIRCLRIRRGERYSADFEPASSFAPDAADVPHPAVLIFDGSKVEGERVIDLSGSWNDGELRTLIFPDWLLWMFFCSNGSQNRGYLWTATNAENTISK